jgi:hypothetical protein
VYLFFLYISDDANSALGAAADLPPPDSLADCLAAVLINAFNCEQGMEDVMKALKEAGLA